MTSRFELVCEKKGCEKLAEIKVRLNDPDGTIEWWSCRRHAMEFKRWAERQVQLENTIDPTANKWLAVSLEADN